MVKKRTIGVPKEIKAFETRVALAPDHVEELVKKGHTVLVEKDAGKHSGFYDEHYKQAGALIVDSAKAHAADIVVRVKHPQLTAITPGQIIAGYFHVEKGHDQELLNTFLKHGNTVFAYHLIFDDEGNRLVNLGEEAGIVGMYEGLRLYGQLQKKYHLFTDMPSSWDCGSRSVMIETFKKITAGKETKTPNIYILGNGIVAKGAKSLLTDMGIPYFILGREKTKEVEKYLPKADIVVNAVYWKPDEPPVITKKMLKLLKPTTPIIDISCDEKGGVETCVEKPWDDPVYEVEGITHFTVGNLPSAIGRDASQHLSDMLKPYIAKLAEGEKIPGTIVHKGEYIYEPPKVGRYAQQ